MLAGASAPSDWYQRGVVEVLLQVVDGVLQPADELAVLGQLRPAARPTPRRAP